MAQAGNAAREEYDISSETNPDSTKAGTSEGASLLSTPFKPFDNMRATVKATSVSGTEGSGIQAVTKGNL